MTKLVYDAPEVTEIGSFEVVTQGGSGTHTIDATFVSGTPISVLTFS
ncbi:hypothetical protein BH10PSE12_BH10PSE12_34760 [soil metagenome]